MLQNLHCFVCIEVTNNVESVWKIESIHITITGHSYHFTFHIVDIKAAGTIESC